MGLQFFPRGGSAHVARNLARNLPAAGWEAAVLSGSLDIPGRPGDARAFYRGLDVTPVDMTAALETPDPMLADPPMHPSYEDRPGAPDRVFASLDDETFAHHARAWARALAAAGARDADVLHLHHLTPINAAAAEVAPGTPVVGHLHGTELLMLEAIEEDPGRWAHGPKWAERLREWAAAAERLIVLSDTQIARAEKLLGTDPDRCVRVANGFDPETFTPREVDRAAVWRRVLVDEPRGWAPGEEAGSVRYDHVPEGPVLLYVGRYTEVKRLPLLIEAFAQAQVRASLVLVGGFPGEWEGEHPLEAIARTGADDVYLAGWHDHEELPELLAASDVVVLPSVREQFGQVLVEGGACRLPAIAVDAYGPSEIVEDGESGWLVPPDDRDALAAALAEAVDRPEERRRRGERAGELAREKYAWPSLAKLVAGVYDAASPR